MIWCGSEGILETIREHISTAAVMNISRDERLSKCQLHYRCVDDTLAVHTNILGLVQDYNPDALGLVDATCNLFKATCTRWKDPPAGANVVPTFDKNLFEHMRTITESISVDSASNEIVGAEDATMVLEDDLNSFLPNCKTVLRDLAHCFRRILSRCWKCDPAIERVFESWIQGPDSPTQLIGHSQDLRNLHHKCCKDCLAEAAVDQAFSGMRHGKHRFESHTTPLSRTILEFLAMLQFLSILSKTRKGRREGTAAMRLLSEMVPADIVLLAMMADAATEALVLIRQTEGRGFDAAQIVAAMKQFLDIVYWLFFQGGCLKIDGHTTYIISLLSTVHFFYLGDQAASIGGIRLTGHDPIVVDCLKRMQAWVVLAKTTTEADVPGFSVVYCFSAFALPEKKRGWEY